MANFSFVALNIETATGKRSSICEIGITIVKDSRITESKSWLIKPEGNVYWNRNIGSGEVVYPRTISPEPIWQQRHNESIG